MNGATDIVNRLLETGDSIKDWLMAQDNSDGVTPEVLRTFKRQAKGYIRWISREDTYDDFGRKSVLHNHDPDDLRKINKARTFEEVEAVLAAYDSEPNFLSMVRAGYF